MQTISNPLLDKLLRHLAQAEQFAYFDTAKPGEENLRSYIFVEPVTRLRCDISDCGASFLQQVQEWLDKGYYVAGWFAYEFGTTLLDRISGLKNIPQVGKTLVADLGVYTVPWHFDHQNGNHNFNLSGQEYPLCWNNYEISDISPSVSEEEYLEALDAVLEYIRAGDTYQVNYTLKLLFELSGSPEALYKVLRRNQSVSYGAYIRWGGERVMSFSPELFFKKSAQGLTVRPMKGTLARGRDGEEDARACAFLHSDQKNRSENVMIVDLLRNDLGRVLHEAGGGEVRVRSLFDVEPYESLLQMTSTIDGIPQDGSSISLQNLFKGLFPCGSITGAPKIRTMEIIHELEKEPRGVYTGAIGFLTPEGEAVFNVPIRTLVLSENGHGFKGEMGVGGGITHDSVPREEWREALLKGRFLTHPAPEFKLIETLLWQSGQGYWLRDEHLDRLVSSANYFHFFCNRDELLKALDAHVAEMTGVRRVRLLLAKDGALAISSLECEPPLQIRLPATPGSSDTVLPKVKFSGKVVPSSQPSFMHKTTQRELYDQEFQRAGDEGCLDVLFTNERGEVTEGAITNICIYKGGRYLTPPVSNGLLAGVMRRKLLEDPEVRLVEETITVEDVLAAEAVFVCNSVRGVIRVRVGRG